MKKLVIVRRCSQILFFCLFVYVLWSTTYPLKGFIPPEVLFKIDPLIMLFTAISQRIMLAGLIFSVLMIVSTLILGRYFCGWICPMGTMIDLWGCFRKKKKVLNDRSNGKLRKTKYLFLILIVILSFAGIQAAWILDPLVIVARFISLNVIPTVTLGIDQTFRLLIQKFELYGELYDFYRELRLGILGVNAYYFANSLFIFLFCLVVMGMNLVIPRLWCRAFCPLGAFYAFLSKFSFLSRSVSKCRDCKICNRNCRMGAIKENIAYEKGECILCMDCIYDCPEKSTRFSFLSNKQIPSIDMVKNQKGITRRDFLFVLASALTFLGFKAPKNIVLQSSNNVIRPPGASDEEGFKNTCIRCGNCMKVCVTNGLQPTMLESGWGGIWTPQLLPEIGYCEYNCTLCGNVCPTQAIPKLGMVEKQKTSLGTAKVNRQACIPWTTQYNCLVCEEHCPVGDKAIKIIEAKHGQTKVYRPVVDKGLCIGCGICQNKCPVRPSRAIQVSPKI